MFKRDILLCSVMLCKIYLKNKTIERKQFCLYLVISTMLSLRVMEGMQLQLSSNFLKNLSICYLAFIVQKEIPAK